MYIKRVIIILFIIVCYGLTPIYAGKSSRNNKKHNRRSPQQRDGDTGTWGNWGYWNPCTKPCGTGLATQTRTCYRSSTSSRDRPICEGEYKRYKLCNSQPCPGAEVHDKKSRCQYYTSSVFKSNTFEWDVIETANPCDLHCRSVNKRFYYRHPHRITNGMPCGGGKHVLGIMDKACVDGSCMEVGCDGNVGSGLVMDRCAVCGGRGNTCMPQEGEFRSDRLTPGYHLIVTLPVGAYRINITEKAFSKNALAIKGHGENGQPYLNMNLNGGTWNREGRYRFAGCLVDYKRPLADEGESVLIEGPLQESLDVMLLFQRDNPGIHYTYLMPLTPPTPNLDMNRFDVGSHDSRFNLQPNYNQYGGRQPTFNTGGQVYPQNPYRPYAPPIVRPRPSSRPLIRPELIKPPIREPQIDIPHDQPLTTNQVNFPEVQRVQNSEVLDDDGGLDTTNIRRDAQVINILRFGEDGLIPESVDGSSNNLHALNGGNDEVDDVTILDLDHGEVFDSYPLPTSEFEWVLGAYGPCSLSCAGGMQKQKMMCVSRDVNGTTTVSDSFCGNLPRPRARMTKCNRSPCPAFYEVGDWSKCSKMCGLGRRSRRVSCKQTFPGNFTTSVSPKRCRKLTKPRAHSRCMVQRCAHWEAVSGWSECNARCGKGTQIRRVACKSAQGLILPDEKCSRLRVPIRSQPCMGVPCVSKWFYTEWGQCQGPCSDATQGRSVQCVNTIRKEVGCRESQTPDSTKSCSKTTCERRKYEWFSANWGPCTVDCGSGEQTRAIVCLEVNDENGSMVVADSSNCDNALKPPSQQTCNTQDCGSRWYFTDWSQCTLSCGGGLSTREVWCLDNAGEIANGCRQSEKPISSQMCNTDKCVVKTIDPKCRDRLTSCDMVQHAGLCSYSYYRKNCCHTCAMADNES